MCTLTWWDHPRGYEVFFNRDERRTRLPAVPPARAELQGVRYLAPQDGHALGTWILVNELGLTVCVLNYYEKEVLEDGSRHFQSRGILLASLANCTDGEEVDQRLQRIDPKSYRAFTLMAFSRGQDGESLHPCQWQWDGRDLRGPELLRDMPVCSSSFQPERVTTGRRRVLSEMAPLDGPEDLDRFHHWDDDGKPSAWTVRMARPDARTWSISRIRVGEKEVSFRYEEVPDQPGQEGNIYEETLARR